MFDMERMGFGSYGCIGAAEAAQATVRSAIEPKEGENMDIQAVTHGLVFLVV